MARSKGILFGCITVHVLFFALDISLIDAFSYFSPLVKRQHYSSFVFAKSGTKKKKVKDSTITVNRNAYRNYKILETFEAGISLVGTEVKSIRDGKMNIRDGFCRPDRRGTCTLHNVHIGKHTQYGPYFQHEERRVRTLLLNKSAARKLAMQAETQGMTVVPLKAYFNDQSKVKFQIGLARGKNVRDKRADNIKERDTKRERRRIIIFFTL